MNEFKIKNGAIISGSITGITEPAQENSTKMASTAWVVLQNYLKTIPAATASVIGGIKVGAGLTIDGNGVLTIPGAAEGTLRTKQSFTATAGQTTFTITGGYTAGLIDIYLNGVFLTGTSVTASNGTTVVLTNAAEVGDILDVTMFSVLNTGFVSGTTDNILEGTTNLYFTNTRARAAISLTTTGTSGAATYNSTTGVLNIPAYQGGVTSFNTRTGAITLSSGDVTTALGFTPENAANKGVANGYASLDGGGLIPSSQLPSYVDDVLEFANLAALPATGETGKIYVALDTNKIYRWSGATYIEVSPTVGTIWGGITGTLANQTDLQSALNAKQNTITLTTTGTSGAATLSGATLNIPQYQAVLTNPITGTGTANDLVKFTAAGVVGDSNIIDTGTLITLGSNTTISNGSLGIGGTTFTGFNGGNLFIGKAITGNVNSNGVALTSTINSDVTGAAVGYRSELSTQAATFTLDQIRHYQATGGTIGAGSTVVHQYGFWTAGLTGATNNYGFYGAIVAGTNRWNIYMDGTANNFMAGSLGIGTTNALAIINVYVQKNITGGTIAYGIAQGGTVLSQVTNQAFGYDNALVTQAASFTLANYYHFSASQGLIGAGSSVTTQIGYNVFNNLTGATNNYGFRGQIPAGTNRWNLYMDGTANNYLAGNLLIGSTTDAGFKLDVIGTTRLNGLTRIQGTTASDAPTLGAELAAVAGTGTGWALAAGATNLNVGGYAHTAGDITPLTTTLAAVIGTYYYLVWTITNRTAGSVTINYAGINLSGRTASDNNGPIATATTALTITPTTDFNGTIALSIKTIGTSSAQLTFVDSFGNGGIEVRGNGGNTIYGVEAGRRNIAANNHGIQNTFVGALAGRNNTTGRFNTFIGHLSGQTNITGTSNVFVGSNTGAANTTGDGNIFIGQSSGTANTTGGSNTFVGLNTGSANITGANNTFVGRGAGQSNTGFENTFIGQEAGVSNTTGGANTFIGRESGLSNSTGANNSVVGWNALRFNNGSNNAVLGYNAGRTIAGGSTSATSITNSILIGFNVKPLANSETNQIVIGIDSTGLGSNTTVLGNASTVTTAIYGNLLLGTTTSTGANLTTAASITAASAIARGVFFNNTLVAAANNDVLVGLDIAPTFTSGAFTGVSNYSIRTSGNIQINSANAGLFNNLGNAFISINSAGLNFSPAISGGYMRFLPFNAGTFSLYMFSSGNVQVNSGTTDLGFKFQVTGTTQFSSTTLIGGTTANASALLQVDSTSQGFLPPRMTAAERTAIASPATGLVVFQTDGTEGLYIKTASAWRALAMV